MKINASKIVDRFPQARTAFLVLSILGLVISHSPDVYAQSSGEWSYERCIEDCETNRTRDREDLCDCVFWGCVGNAEAKLPRSNPSRPEMDIYLGEKQACSSDWYECDARVNYEHCLCEWSCLNTYSRLRQEREGRTDIRDIFGPSCDHFLR